MLGWCFSVKEQALEVWMIYVLHSILFIQAIIQSQLDGSSSPLEFIFLKESICEGNSSANSGIE